LPAGSTVITALAIERSVVANQRSLARSRLAIPCLWIEISIALRSSAVWIGLIR